MPALALCRFYWAMDKIRCRVMRCHANMRRSGSENRLMHYFDITGYDASASFERGVIFMLCWHFKDYQETKGIVIDVSGIIERKRIVFISQEKSKRRYGIECCKNILQCEAEGERNAIYNDRQPAYCIALLKREYFIRSERHGASWKRHALVSIYQRWRMKAQITKCEAAIGGGGNFTDAVNYVK